MSRSILFGGALLALLGLFGLAVPLFTTEQSKEVAHVGDLKLQTTQTTAYAVPTLVSGGAVVLGIALIGAALYRRA